MRASIVAATLAVLALFAPAAAAERPLLAELPRAKAACWERVYDAAHLTAHPAQKVAAVRLVHLPQSWRPPEQTSVYVVLYLNLRQRKASEGWDYQLSGFCKPRGQELHCVPEWEAGSWRLARGPGGALDVRNGGIIANPNPYDAEEIADGAVKLPAKPDDGIWRLMPARDACKIE